MRGGGSHLGGGVEAVTVVAVLPHADVGNFMAVGLGVSISTVPTAGVKYGCS